MAAEGTRSDVKKYAHPGTLRCAATRCIPCLHKLLSKIGPGIGILPPNQRPETCPRHANQRPETRTSSVGLYTAGQRILTVGDGDFSFSLSVARLRLQGGSVLVSSSHESEESVRSTYPNAGVILGDLERLGAHVFHGVDATDLGATRGLEMFREEGFDVIIWNFPCVGAARKSDDGQVSEISRNQDLLRTFFRSAQAFLGRGGEIHVTHKTIEPFSWWGIVQLATESGLTHIGSVAFDRCLYPGYINRKVLDKKSFPAHDAETYVFTVGAAESKTLSGLEELDDAAVARLLAVASAGAGGSRGDARKKDIKTSGPKSGDGSNSKRRGFSESTEEVKKKRSRAISPRH